MSRLCNTISTRNQAVNSCVPEEETVPVSLVLLVAVTRAIYLFVCTRYNRYSILWSYAVAKTTTEICFNQDSTSSIFDILYQRQHQEERINIYLYIIYLVGIVECPHSVNFKMISALKNSIFFIENVR